MGTDGDAVFPLCYEDPTKGGSEEPEMPTTVDPWEDRLACRGLWVQRPSPDTTVRKEAGVSQDGSGNLTFKDASNDTLTLSALVGGGFDIDNIVWDDPGGIVYDNDGKAVKVS